jgi:Xaa-Pro aminopeptidase
MVPLSTIGLRLHLPLPPPSPPLSSYLFRRAKTESCRVLTKDEILLLDSGGQYLDGTTDLTRTIHIGDPTPYQVTLLFSFTFPHPPLSTNQKEMYTRVLMGHIDLASTTFPPNTPGCLLDAIARRPLWSIGKNYLHGTGHGVGAALNVHEGPQRISSLLTGRNYSTPLVEGMIVSIEPGYYETGSFGIRLENLYVIKRAAATPDGPSSFLQFEALTFVPFQRNLIEISLLSSSQLAWINRYHEEVSEKIQCMLRGRNTEDREMMRWLQDLCQPLE